MNITFKGTPVTLTGKTLRAGDLMPDFTVTGKEMNPVTLADTQGVRIFLAVPSLDTPVCDLEVRTFVQRLQQKPGVTVWAVSMDLPFAQSRWCAATGVASVHVVSDYKERSFGAATGTMIQELGLLTRAVFVVDQQGNIVYTEYVQEVSSAPDYDAALKQAEALL